MYMHTGYLETVVFSGWTTTNPGNFAISCVGLFFIGVLLEAIKMYRCRLLRIRKLANKINRSLNSDKKIPYIS